MIVVTNQSGVARGLYGLDDVERFHAAMARRVTAAGGRIDTFYVSPCHAAGHVASYASEHEDHKPGPGMLLRAMRDFPIDPARSVIIGDKPSDVEAGRRAGVRGIQVNPDTCDLRAVAQTIIS